MKPLMIGIFSLVLLAGMACTQSKAVYTFNPDGSGKADIQLVQLLDGWKTLNTNNTESREERARKRVRAILEDSKGVEAWRNLRYQVLVTKDNPYLVLEATVYFKDAGLLKFEDQNRFLRPAWKPERGGGAVLEIKPGASEGDDEDEQKPAPPDPPAEYKELVEKLRLAEERGALRMLQVLVERYRQEMTFHLPGDVREAEGMTRVNDRTVRLVFEGDQLSKALGRLAEQEDAKKFLESLNDAKVKELNDVYKILQRLLDSPFQARVTLEGELAPQFEYEAEVMKAREEYDAMLTRLGLK